MATDSQPTTGPKVVVDRGYGEATVEAHLTAFYRDVAEKRVRFDAACDAIVAKLAEKVVQ